MRWRRAMCCLGWPLTGCTPTAISLVRKLVEQRAWLGCAVPMGRGHAWARPADAHTALCETGLGASRAAACSALAHITGGGLTENLPRVLPEGLGAEIDLNAWDLPSVFKWLARRGGMAEAELLKTFNSGIGMMLVVKADHAASVNCRAGRARRDSVSPWTR